MMENKPIPESAVTFPESLKNSFQKVDDKFLSEARKRMDKEFIENSQILEKLNNDSFLFIKDLLILVGTIFGSSIALSVGRNVNNFFIFGEFFLFLSLVSGLIILTAKLNSKEWDYAFSSKNSLEGFLLLNKDKIDTFERENIENLVKEYQGLINVNQRGILYKILRHVSIEKWPIIFNVTFLTGVGLILISTIQLKSFNISSLFKLAIFENFYNKPDLIMWLMFSIIFLLMSLNEFKKSKRGLFLESINLGFSDLNNAYETTRKAIINADKESHSVAAASYFLAGLTALASFLILFFKN